MTLVQERFITVLMNSLTLNKAKIIINVMWTKEKQRQTASPQNMILKKIFVEDHDTINTKSTDNSRIGTIIIVTNSDLGLLKTKMVTDSMIETLVKMGPPVIPSSLQSDIALRSLVSWRAKISSPEKIEDSINGNFVGLIELLAEYDPLLREHISRVKKAQEERKRV
ncbi:hypothetical protein J6590_025171 [Homalodisca vitripennis]|nr:hypothetical protein J6590_025171 [Homalodisca vitripennis]